MSKGLEGVVNYAGVAKMLGVGVRSVRQYGYRDPRFPKPVTPEGSRSPLFLVDEIRKWDEERKKERRHKAGRPVENAERVELSEAGCRKLRELIDENISLSRAGLAEKLGISASALGFRLQGKTRWAGQEITVLARLMKIRVAELHAVLRDA